MNDQQFMSRALDLAARGIRSASPNPMVGCIIVHDGTIIGEGWHAKFGDDHAEVMAVESVVNKSLIAKSIVYVTLEPCSFHGKTPACTDLLLKYKPSRVVVASLDPNPKVSGKGIEILRGAGIVVDFGTLTKEAGMLNRRFFITMNLRRPYIVLKWAQTSDGFIARRNFDSKWISNSLSRQLVHKWRSEEDAILVGYNTVKYDNPSLTVRDWHGTDPVRIIIDPRKELESGQNVFDSSVKTYWLNTVEGFEQENLIAKCFPHNHSLEDELTYCYEQEIGSILVEGGAATLTQFIEEGLWDEARIFTSDEEFGDGISAPLLDLPEDSEQLIQGDRLSVIFNPKTSKFWQKNY